MEKRYLSATVLLLTNLLIILPIVFFGESIYNLLGVYWIQGIALGIFAIFRLNRINIWKSSFKESAINFLGMFIISNVLYAMVFFMAFPIEKISLSWMIIIIGGLTFFLNHLFSFYLYKDIVLSEELEMRRANKILFTRIIPLQIIFCTGAFLFQNRTLWIFIALKILFDLNAHQVEHSAKNL